MNPPPTAPKTPLGEPMDEFGASVRAQYPQRWHLKYWLNIYVIGTLRLQDAGAMEIRIRIENRKALENSTYLTLSAWSTFKRAHEAEFRTFWHPRLFADDEQYRAYVRDLDRMLECKDAKMNAYLRPRIESARRLTGATKVFADSWLRRLHRGLAQERRRELAARREAGVSNRVSGGE